MLSRQARYIRSICTTLSSHSCKGTCLRLHDCDSGMTEHVNGHTKGRFSELSTGGAQNATKCKSRFLGTVKASKDVPFCQVAFENAVYKVLEVGQL